MSSICIICPLYNAEKELESLNKSLLMQENVDIKSIKYVLTKSKDSSEDILNKIGAEYITINQDEFSHSATREMMAKKVTEDIIVFISQDIKIKRKDWLYYLTKDIASGKCVAAYSRQIADKNNIEKYTREKNYGNESYYKSKKDLKKMGLNTFFYSDASSAIDRKTFEELNYYDGKRLTSNEDQYIAYKIIMAGYTIKYCAESVVVHSHNFSFKSLFKRYQDTGEFYRQESHMDEFGTNNAGFNMAKYILKRIIEDKNWKAAIEFIPNMLARFLGMKIPKKAKYKSKEKKWN